MVSTMYSLGFLGCQAMVYQRDDEVNLGGTCHSRTDEVKDMASFKECIDEFIYAG